MFEEIFEKKVPDLEKNTGGQIAAASIFRKVKKKETPIKSLEKSDKDLIRDIAIKSICIGIFLEFGMLRLI